MTNTSGSWAPLPREEVIKAVERRGPARVPLIESKLWDDGVMQQYGGRMAELDRYPEDKKSLWMSPMSIEAMGLSWEIQPAAAYDSQCVIDDWAKLDEFIEKLPDPENDPQIDALMERAEEIRSENIYMLFGWWGFMFERPWGILGMERLLTDYHLEKENVHRLNSALCDLQCAYVRRAASELQPDGFWTSDDLGHQTQPMMGPEIFDEMIKPYYDKMGRTLRELNLHWWLHSCGNNTPLLPSLIDAGVDVLHPVQKHAMDEIAVAGEFGDRLSFLVGIDVQQIIRLGTPEDVRAEVRHLIDTFDRPGGGMCMGAGNVMLHGTPFENIEAYLDEALRYGTEHRSRYKK